jgi:hypothetical protein
LVICSKCGADNEKDSRFCSGCGAALGREQRRVKSSKDECFGLPHGGAIFGLFIGTIIILWGLSSLFGWNIEIGTFALITIGLLIIAGAIYTLTRKRSW